MKSITKTTVIYFFACFTLVIPFLLFYMGMKTGGIDLKNTIISKELSMSNFYNLFFSDLSYAKSFRYGIFLSIIYSSIVGIIVLILSIAANLWITGFSKKSATGFTFFLLTLTLLPQTYLVIMALKLTTFIPHAQNEFLRIFFYLLISVLPVSIWFFYFFSNIKIRKLLSLFALDSLYIGKIAKIILSDIKSEIMIIFVFVILLVWGNFLIPYSLGTSNSYTAIVYISSFTTNLGRDWALISAASFLLLVPIIFLTITNIYYGKKR